MGLPIESLRRRDIPQFIDLLRRGFADDLAVWGTDPARLSRMLHPLLAANGVPLRVLRRITGHAADLLVARSGDRLVACLAILGRGKPVLTGMYVVPEFREQQLALSMVNEALDRLKRRGRSHVTIYATGSAAQGLAERAGFAVCDRINLYQRQVPARIPAPERFRVRRGRGDLSGNAYDLGWLKRLSRIRSAQFVVSEGERDVLACSLSALPHQRTVEIKAHLLTVGHEEALVAALGPACAWIESLGREEAHLPLSADQEAFAQAAQHAGFESIRSWTHLERDLANP
jgi:GNAT superfamily N-acetyltransferase